jgi:hypothetical protein
MSLTVMTTIVALFAATALLPFTLLNKLDIEGERLDY